MPKERLKEFKKEFPGVLVNDDRTYFTRLEAMRSQLQTARLDLQEQEHRRTALSEQLKNDTCLYRWWRGLLFVEDVPHKNPIDLSIQNASGCNCRFYC